MHLEVEAFSSIQGHLQREAGGRERLDAVVGRSRSTSALVGGFIRSNWLPQPLPCVELDPDLAIEFPAETPTVIGLRLLQSVPLATGALACLHLKPGEHIVIVGASGDVGLAATQVALSQGARVAAITPKPGNLARAATEQVRVIVDTEDVHQSLVEWSAGRGVEGVLGAVGGSTPSEALRALLDGGRAVLVDQVSESLMVMPTLEPERNWWVQGYLLANLNDEELSALIVQSRPYFDMVDLS